MRRYVWTTVFSAVLFSVLAAGRPVAAQSRPDGYHDDSPPPCTLRLTKGLYGFQCHGSALAGSTFEPITFIGTVEGDGRGLFEGYGTFNTNLGSVSTHVKGLGTLSNRCFGHVDYTTNEIIVPGGTIPLPPISFDYTVVDGGKEILGTGVAAPGIYGVDVPRVTCRLVRTR